jgi:hypothetical protein
MGDYGRSLRFGVIVDANARGHEETSALVGRADEEGLDLVGVPDVRDGYARSERLGACGLRGTCRRVGAARHVPLLPAVSVMADDFGRPAPVGTLATDIIVGSAPPEKAGAASGISETSAEFGGALGIAILGSIGTAVYRSEVANALPENVPPDAAEAARDTLGGALAVSDELPDQVGVGLLDAVREAFTPRGCS